MEIKIPFYNILNMFLTGLVFMGGCAMVFPDYAVAILTSDIIVSVGTVPEIIFTVCALAAAYEVGLIINRIGSVIVGPILTRTKAIPFDDDYVKYNTQKKKYPIMNTLSREFALSRTGIALFIMLTVVAIYGRNTHLTWLFGVTVIVYFLSCRKHAKKIVTLMEDVDTDETEININISE